MRFSVACWDLDSNGVGYCLGQAEAKEFMSRQKRGDWTWSEFYLG
jgi:hypothetical protein